MAHATAHSRLPQAQGQAPLQEPDEFWQYPPQPQSPHRPVDRRRELREQDRGAEHERDRPPPMPLPLPLGAAGQEPGKPESAHQAPQAMPFVSAAGPILHPFDREAAPAAAEPTFAHDPSEPSETLPAGQLQQPATGSYFRLYVGIWGVLAAAALGYLAMLATRPEMVASPLRQPGVAEADSGMLQRGMSRALTELKGLGKSLGDVQKELAQVKASVTALDDRDRAILARLTAVEERPAVTATTAAMPGSPATKTADAKADSRIGARGLSGGSVQGYVDDAAAPGGRQDPGQQKLAMTPPAAAPGSPAAAGAAADPASPVVIGPAVVTPTRSAAREPVSIQIGSGPSLDSIRLTWSLLQERHKNQLRRLEPRVVAGTTSSEPPFQLLAGPIPSAQEAQRICQALKARKVECTVVPAVVGDAL